MRWDNGHNELIVYTNNDLIKQLGTGEIVITESAQSSIHSARPTPTPEPEPDMTMLLRLRVGTKVKCDGAVGIVTAKNDNSTSVRWGGPRIPSRAYSNEELAKELNTGEIVITGLIPLFAQVVKLQLPDCCLLLREAVYQSVLWFVPHL